MRSVTLLPLYGTIQPDYELFQYFPLRIWEKGVELASPSWLSQCYLLNEYDFVNLHIPLYRAGQFFTRGVIESVDSSPDKKMRIYRLAFVKEVVQEYPVWISIKEGERPQFESNGNLEKVFRTSIKECVLLKKGVGVYLKHLAAYFSRTTGFSTEIYSQLSQIFFEDVFATLNEKIKKLAAIEAGLHLDDLRGAFHIPDSFQEIHQLVISEVNLDLLNLAFKTGEHVPYIVSIKELEEKLYWHYNTIVLIYDHYLRAQSKDLKERLERKIQARTIPIEGL